MSVQLSRNGSHYIPSPEGINVGTGVSMAHSLQAKAIGPILLWFESNIMEGKVVRDMAENGISRPVQQDHHSVRWFGL